MNQVEEDNVKLNRLFLITSFLIITFNINNQAHVQLVFPTGGETFEANSTITIQWAIEIDHGPCNWDLYFSSDGGSNWSVIALDLPKIQLTYDWTVPAIATQQAKIRVVQDNVNVMPYQDISGVFTIDVATGINEADLQTSDYRLYPAYPNPFNPETNIRYTISQPGFISLKVYNLLGEEIATLAEGLKQSGTYNVSFRGEGLPSGIYIYALKAGSFSAVRKFILLK